MNPDPRVFATLEPDGTSYTVAVFEVAATGRKGRSPFSDRIDVTPARLRSNTPSMPRVDALNAAEERLARSGWYRAGVWVAFRHESARVWVEIGGTDEQQRLARIALRVYPCPAPDAVGGYDLCPCGDGRSWPCSTTIVAWYARGLSPGEQIAQQNARWRQDAAGLAAAGEAW